MNGAENKIAELEKRISKLEEKLENMMIYSDGANLSRNHKVIFDYLFKSSYMPV